jgi:hypothetical protein
MVVALVLTVPAGGQPVTAGPGFTQVRIGGDLNRYEARYGEPENRSLDEGSEGWPRGQSIRTVGQLEEVPISELQRRDPRRSEPQGTESPRHGYILSGKHRSLVPTPVPEIADMFAAHAPYWRGRGVEIVGAYVQLGARGELEPVQRLGKPSPRSGREVFLVWSMLVLPERDENELSAPRSTLETLVIDHEASAGSLVTVKGTFRGANLFSDLPAESRRHAQDWVLKDGPFFIWVTGAKPDGVGFSLGLQTRSDCRWRLAVQGEVETHDGYVYLRASKARLLGRARDEPEVEGP